MELRNTPALLNHVDKLTSQLVTRFLNLVDLARVPETNRNLKDSDVDGSVSRVPDRNQAAVNTLKMQVETAALVRAAEDILTLSRQLKEMWLFGQLDTLGDSKSAGVETLQVEDDAKAVMKGIVQLLEKSGTGSSGTPENRPSQTFAKEDAQ